MKLKHYLLIGLVAWLGAHLPIDLRWPIDRNFFGPLTTHAQQGGFVSYSNIKMAHVTSDFTDANASGLQAIPAMQLALPANQASSWWLDCTLAFSQATAAADNFGVGFSVAPTASLLSGIAATNATAYASGTPANITNTTATAVITFTPAVATVLMARIWGFIENPTSGQDNIVTIYVAQGTAANVVVTKKDSACMAHSMN